MLALGAELAARGHEVVYETWSRWRAFVETEGMSFLAALEHAGAPPFERSLQPYRTVVMATRQTRVAIAQARPDVVVHDILTLAPALAAELEGVPVATLIPHVYPVGRSGFPPYALGARMPRTAAGRTLWRVFDRPVVAGLRRGREEFNDARSQLGLPPVQRLHAGLSQQLCLVGTFPQLEYPRPWPDHVHVVGPLLWEPPFGRVDPPAGDDPLILVAPSTAQDPQHRLLRAALAGLAREPVRVLATWNRRPLPGPTPVAANSRLVEWLSYSKTMPDCDLVIGHAGHGTLVRALSCGCPVLAVPHAGDMAENAARVDWAGAGVRLPWPLLSPGTLRLATRRALADRSLAETARQLGAWSEARSGAQRAADLLEGLAHGRQGSQVGAALSTPSLPGELSPPGAGARRR